MKCGIIGLPNIGKSTLFNIVSNSKALSKNFPFCTINPNYGIIKILDKRLTELEKIINPLKITPSEIKIVDIAGLIKGSHKGEGLGNKFLSHIRETNAIIHMIRFFYDESITHVEGNIDPVRDKEIIDTELQMKDLESIEKKIYQISRLYNSNYNKNEFYIFLKKILNFLIKGNNIRTFPFKKWEKKSLEELNLLTIKPILYICNVNNFNDLYKNLKIKQLKKIINKESSSILFISLKNKICFDFDKFLYEIISLLNLKTFFTVGKNEVRAWNIPKSYTAYEASSVIHTDFQKGFIKAEIIHYDDYIQYKSEYNLKKLGKIFLSGKDYIINDGDIVTFRFNINKKIFYNRC
ncbi:redox-regulated ATPase YchF [Blattabacterium cuenoti]|uniref:redox-regulated ATPase YchF n=1 Tax=Blattabacterium cuenoti TaxID=1653831 RepID=UPI00163B87A6|nr:redox-regulated ATPase YchF [Blattabacterium cuenoti]